MATERIRGSIWANKTKKPGFGQSIGSYDFPGGDRQFKLTVIKTKKTRVYESPQAAMRDGWFIVKHAV